MPRNPLAFALLLIGEIWLAHAVAFFAHEYAHSFTAWAFGFKGNPLALHFGDWSFWNVAIMIDIDENVDYGPVFAEGQGTVAAMIAAAGVLSGAVLYLVSLFAYKTSGSRKAVKMFFYLLCIMSAGNLIDYVPIRTFSPSADMHTVEEGLGVSPWMVLLGLGLPFLAIMLHLLLRLLPDARHGLFGGDGWRPHVLVVVSTFLVFVFFSAAGLESGTGEVATRLSQILIFGGFPIATVALWPRTARPVPQQA